MQAASHTNAPTSAGTSNTDRIEREVRLQVPRSRVWNAIADSQQFGKWFGMQLDEPFVAGATAHGRMTVKGYEHLTVELAIDRVEPEHLFSFRWHPYAIDPDADYSNEPMTLITFTLDPIEGGTLLRVVESGFDRIPASRRVKAFEMDSRGWEGQLRNITKYLATQD